MSPRFIMTYRFFILTLVFLLLVACQEKAQNKAVEIADKTFVIPKEWEHWDFSERYAQLTLNLNVEDYKPFKAKKLEEKRKKIRFRVVPVFSTLARSSYGTEKDSFLKKDPVSCEVITYSYQKFELCDYGFRGSDKVSQRMYTIKNLSKNSEISVLMCLERSALPNPMCLVSGRFLDNLQINYGYNISYFERAVEIDQTLRELVLDFYQPVPKEQNNELYAE